jgi:hypothetical protein
LAKANLVVHSALRSIFDFIFGHERPKKELKHWPVAAIKRQANYEFGRRTTKDGRGMGGARAQAIRNSGANRI